MSATRALSLFLCVTLVAATAGADVTPAAPPAPAAAATSRSAATPVTLDVGLGFGFGTRLGDSPYYDVTTRAGAFAGVSAWLAPSPGFALGLAYQHLGLGKERTDVGLGGSLELDRGAHLVWAGLRLFPLRSEYVAFYLEVAPGLAFQHVSASGVLGSSGPVAILTPFTCSAADSADFALRAGFGADFSVGEAIHASLGATMDNMHLSSEPLGECVNGAGTVTELSLGAGVSYRFDVSRFTR